MTDRADRGMRPPGPLGFLRRWIVDASGKTYVELSDAPDAVSGEPIGPERRLPGDFAIVFDRDALRWQVRQPIVTRYLERLWINKFRDEAILRLSSFSRFTMHRDEARGDGMEGKIMVMTPIEGGTGIIVSTFGHDTYVLSTAMREGEDLARAFNTPDFFRIVDTAEFGVAMAQAITGCGFGVEGPCIYQEFGQSVIGEKTTMTPREFADIGAEKGPGARWSNDDANIAVLAGSENFHTRYFLKGLKYQSQCEYRFIWMLGEDVPPYFDVYCPNALQYCEFP